MDFSKLDFKKQRQCIILRGEPGVGKSTLAKKIIQGIAPIKTISHCEADSYFVRPDGVYDFNYNLLRNAHTLCRNEFEAAIYHKYHVIISNTNVKASDVKSYADFAAKNGYNITVVRLTKNWGTIHNVPQETVDKMRESMEAYTGEILL
jgi:predicted kinase